MDEQKKELNHVAKENRKEAYINAIKVIDDAINKNNEKLKTELNPISVLEIKSQNIGLESIKDVIDCLNKSFK